MSPPWSRSLAPGMAMTASTPPAKLLASNRRVPRKIEDATSQQMIAVLWNWAASLYLCFRHLSRDSPDTMVSLAVPS
mgnify:CR=1 FL=1